MVALFPFPFLSHRGDKDPSPRSDPLGQGEDQAVEGDSPGSAQNRTEAEVAIPAGHGAAGHMTLHKMVWLVHTRQFGNQNLSWANETPVWWILGTLS